MSIKSIISLTEVEKPIYNLLVEQSQLPPDKVRDATSLYGSGLYEILNNGETISGLNHSDALLLFALHTVDNESDISQTFENNQINYYKAFELEITIYGDIAADYAFPLAARLRTSAVRQSTFDKGIYIRTVENPVEVHEFVSGTVWTQYNFKVNIGVRFNIEPVTNDYSIEEKGEVKIMHTSDWARMLYPARAESPVEIRESANGIELVYKNGDVVLIPFEFGAGIIAQVKNAEKGKKLLITAPGGGGSHEGGRAFDVAEEILPDTVSVLQTAITVPPGLQIAVGDMLFGVNGGRALIINIPDGNTTVDVMFLGLNAPAREVVRFNAPVSAMNGTLTETELATLQDNEANYIEFNHENYYLADAQHEAGFLVYSHVGHDSADNFFVKCITITLSTRGWVLNIGYVYSSLNKSANTAIKNNLLSINEISIGKYVNHINGQVVNNENYNVFSYVKIKENTSYTTNCVHYAFYDINFEFISGGNQSGEVTSPTRAKYFRGDFYSDTNTNSPWDYFLRETSKKCLFSTEGLQDNPGNNSKYIMSQKAVSDAIQSMNKGIFTIHSEDTTSNQFTINNLPADSYIYQIMAKVNTFDSIKFGHGFSGWNTSTVTINNTSVIVALSDIPTTYQHNLTIKDYIYVTLNVEPSGTAKLVIYTGNQNFEKSFTFGKTSNNNHSLFTFQSDLTDIDFSLIVPTANSDIWAFGDSYFENYPSRWIYYLLANGYDKHYLNHYTGETSASAFADFSIMLNTGNKPKKVLWCMGMNDGSDVGDIPSKNWKDNLDRMISKCDINRIEPILATIPTIPTVNNEAKNAYVRESGYRYVDFAKAVGASPEGVWYPGMLSDDETHPAEPGGKALYMAALLGCPELTFDN